MKGGTDGVNCRRQGHRLYHTKAKTAPMPLVLYLCCTLVKCDHPRANFSRHKSPIYIHIYLFACVYICIYLCTCLQIYACCICGYVIYVCMLYMYVIYVCCICMYVIYVCCIFVLYIYVTYVCVLHICECILIFIQ